MAETRKTVTIVFSDVAGSTSLGERLDPEAMRRDLAEVLAALARGLGDRETRQRAADRALEIANAASGADAPAGSTLAVAITGVRMVATDVMVFAGIDLDDAVQAVGKGVLEQRIAAPPRRRRFGRLRRRLTR
jgi:class 3 adenylate cyclase